MNGVRVNKIQIHNFKIYKDCTFDFSENQLIIFDGPNGFGKSSFFDALEILFTGSIRRYHELAESVLDNRQNYDKPFVNDIIVPEIYVRAEVQSGDKLFYIKRKVFVEEISDKIDFEKFKLYQTESWEDKNDIYITDEFYFLSRILGLSYKKNFEFLNYIEQEENIHLLKKTGKEKSSDLGYLFNTDEFSSIIKKIDIVQKKVGKLFTKTALEELKIERKELEDLKKQQKENEETVEFKQLFNNNYHIDWDKEDFVFEDVAYAEIVLGENGELSKINDLITNKVIYKKYITNNEIKSYLTNKGELSVFFNFANFIDSSESLVNKKILLKNIETILNSFNDITIESFQNDSLKISDKIIAIFTGFDNLKYEHEIAGIKAIANQFNSVEQNLVSILSSRDNLIQKFKENKESALFEGNCPLCGHNWEHQEDLIDEIDKQTTIYKDLNKGFLDIILLSINTFKNEFLNSMSEKLRRFLVENPIDNKFIDDLSMVDKSIIYKHESFLKSIDITNYKGIINNSPTYNENLDEFIKLVSTKLEIIDEIQIKSFYKDVFFKYFSSNWENLNMINLELVLEKRRYLEWRYLISLNDELSRKKLKYIKKESTIQKAKDICKKLSDLKSYYDQALHIYNKQIIDNTEILFHIISGRIMQNSQSGRGLFLLNEKNEIRFLTDPFRKLDAVFSMSSGQLASLIISFTLTMNKIYSKEKLLLIDDPIQSMDEINIMGLIETLRNDFSDRQIIISTHEKEISNLIAYKFKKYQIPTMQIDFKKLNNN